MNHKQSIRMAVLPILFAGIMVSISNAAVITWDASSGQTPDQMGYELVDNSNPENPILNGSILTIGNNSASESMYYAYREPTSSLLFPSVFEASFRMRYVSGSQSYNGRSPAGVFVTTGATGEGVGLYIDAGRVFLSDTFVSPGPVAAVDTDSVFHDYLLRIDGGAVSVFQDGGLILSGSTKTSFTEMGTSPRVLFGDGTTLESGTSEWANFSHNAAIPEPSTAVLLGVSALVMYRLRQKRFR